MPVALVVPMGHYFQGGVIFICVVIIESEYTRTETVESVHCPLEHLQS